MNSEVALLQRLIEQYRLHYRYPGMLEPVMKVIKFGQMRPFTAKTWIRRIQPLIEAQKQIGNYLPRPPTQEELLLDGKTFDIVLGHLVERPNVPIGVRLSDGVFHIIATGKSGSGKSVFLRGLVKKGHEYGLQYPDKKVIYIIFDSKKDFRDHEFLFGTDAIYLSVHDNKTKIGLQGPPGVAPAIWINFITTCLAARLGLIISRTCLANIMSWLMPILNPSPGPHKPLTWPSLRLILDILENSKSSCWASKIDYIKTLVQLLEALLVDSAGLFDTERGLDLNEDVISQGKHCIIDIANYNPPYLRHIIIDILLQQVLTYRINHELKTDQTEIAVVIDEADLFVNPKAQETYPESISPLCLYARLAREFGLQLTIGASALANVAPYILSSASYLIALNTTDSNSIFHIQRTLQLEPGTEKLLPALPPGQCIYREAGPYPYPVLAQIDYVPPYRA